MEENGPKPTAFVSAGFFPTIGADVLLPPAPFVLLMLRVLDGGDARTVYPAQLHALEMETGGCGREREASGGRMRARCGDGDGRSEQRESSWRRHRRLQSRKCNPTGMFVSALLTLGLFITPRACMMQPNPGIIS